jgi:hypothetical protein
MMSRGRQCILLDIGNENNTESVHIIIYDMCLTHFGSAHTLGSLLNRLIEVSISYISIEAPAWK